MSHENRSPWRWYVCGLLFLATTINYVDRNVFALLEPALKQLPFMQYDAANPQVYNNHYANILFWFQLAYGVSFLLVGRFIDRVGTKIGYAVAILVWSLAAASHALVGSVMGFIFARVALGFGEAGNFPAAIKASTEWFPTEERALATGIFNSGANVASFVAPYLVAWIAYAYGWKSAFVATGALGVFWFVLWVAFPYNRRRRDMTLTQANLNVGVDLAGDSPKTSWLVKQRGLYAFSVLKFMTDPIWWFYLNWLPKYFNEHFGFNMKQNALPLLVIYSSSSLGSVGGGFMSGFLMKRGMSVNAGRKIALVTCAACSLPVLLVPSMTNPWAAVALLSLAAAAHQGFSANVFSTATDMFPGAGVSTVVGIGGAAGALGGALFMKFAGWMWETPMWLFGVAGTAYLTSVVIFHLLVPRLGLKLKQPMVMEPTNP